jgi:nucleotide-binding universal stress UspA family protein
MYDSILLATNGGVASEDAEAHAIDLAASVGATLHVVYVVDEAVTTAYSGDEYVDEAEGPEHGLEEHGREVLDSVRERAADAGVESVVDGLLYGGPARQVVRYADDEAVDLLVLGTKRRPDEYRSLLGSVTDRVLRLTDRPLTVVKTDVEP